MARIGLLHAFGRLPRPRQSVRSSVESIFYSFPYHSVGDLVLSLVLLDHVHERWPMATIDVAVGASMAPLVESLPYVRKVYRLSKVGNPYSLGGAYREIVAATNLYESEIASTQYDLAISPRWDSADSYFGAYLAYLTGAPVRCGYSSSCDGGSRAVDRLFTIAALGGNHKHESLRYKTLLIRCGLEPEDSVSQESPREPIAGLLAVAQRRRERGEAMTPPCSERSVVLSPGATNPRRMWPIERFAEVAKALWANSGLRSVVIGGPGDVGLCSELQKMIGDSAISMAGKTNSLQMLDLIASASLFLGNDSGPAHIAGGLGVPTIVVSPFPLSCQEDHPNSPARFRPAGPAVEVVQPSNPSSPCSPMCLLDSPHCILQVKPKDVLETAGRLLP
jgi:ADP-heptose:LPS heptosyltransferase